MPIKVEAFKCKYCIRILSSGKACERHESHCLYDPKALACHSCQFADFRNTETDGIGMPAGSTVEPHFTCGQGDFQPAVDCEWWEKLEVTK